MTLASSGLQVHNGDLLRVEAWSNVAVTLRGNFLFRPILWPERRAVTLSTTDMAVPATRATTNATVLVTEDGFVEGCTVINVATAATQRGQTYGLVTLQRSGVTIAVLASDYIFSDYSLSLGTIVCPGPAGGHGSLAADLNLTDPAAGTEFATQTVPTGAIWRPRHIQCLAGLVTDATAGNRQLEIRYSSLTNIIGGGKSDPIPPSSTSPMMGGLGIPTGITAAAVGALVGITLPDAFLAAGYTLSFITRNLAAADNYGQGIMHVEEWVMPNP